MLSVYSSACCDIGEAQRYLRCQVGPGQAHEVQDCYRTLAAECLLRKGKSTYHLVVVAPPDPAADRS